MMTRSLSTTLLICLFARLAHSARVKTRTTSLTKRGNTLDTDPPPEQKVTSCCCTKGPCKIDPAKTENIPQYTPNQDLCCKKKDYSCGSWWNGNTKYVAAAPNLDFCVKPQSNRFVDHTKSHEEYPVPTIKPSKLKPGSTEHTIHTYCDFKGHEEDEGEEEKAEGEGVAKAEAKNSIVKALVHELSKNSMDSMAKDIFSMYVCARWAPTTEFIKAGNDEMKTQQLDKKPMNQHIDDFTFMPMRCGKNINVYGGDKKLGETHFDYFEKQMEAESAWLLGESKGAVNKRLQHVFETTGPDQKEASLAFDLHYVRKAVATCKDTVSANVTVDTYTAPTSALLKDCAAAKWWLVKMEDWHKAMPFVSFMSPPKDVVENAKPSSTSQLLVCFGKRVASQLHRRKEGNHLVADQSMVGCHGFWKFAAAAKMLDRIVKLWRPPTCQLAAMELDMKMKIMDVIASMNQKLFDALPAMLDDEASSKVIDEDGVPLEAAGGAGTLMGLAHSVVSSFSSMNAKYVRLGQMLGNTVVKWVVCPMKPVKDQNAMSRLDMALGTEDDLARYYAKTAYEKWTGKNSLLPGEECRSYDVTGKSPQLPRKGLLRCSLAEMRENMPERYKNEEFLCPTRPLLPASQQLEVLRAFSWICPMRLNTAQMNHAKWFYRGRRPQANQYDVMANYPKQHYQSIKLLDMDSKYDSTYYITRTFVNIGLGCTEEEAVLTPRFCAKPTVENEPSVAWNLLTGVGNAGSYVGRGAVQALQAVGVVEETPPNNAYMQRVKSWMAGKAKVTEQWLRGGSEALFGRSGGRYAKLHKRSFAHVEAAELVHEISFQTPLSAAAHHGNSSGDKRFDRFAAMAPCDGFDPNRNFRLKYTWTEHALSLATKAFQQNTDPNFGQGSGAFKMEMRSDAVLRMRDATEAWMEYYLHLRSSNVGGAYSKWQGSANPWLMDLAGVFNIDSDHAFTVDTLRGFEATFACGTRTEMHDLAMEFTELPGNFRECVKQGKVKNAALRESNPTMPFLKNEVVVRVTFKSMRACEKDLVSKAEEKVNPVFQNFANVGGCIRAGSNMGIDVPETLTAMKGEETYRGMLLGKGMPPETLREVLVDPEDFLEEVTL